MMANAKRLGRRAEWFLLRRQKRRRAAHSASSLLSGLLQFYSVAPGATHVRSWNETEALPDAPLLGFDVPFSEGSGGTYQLDDVVLFSILPYREIGVRTYAGIVHRFELSTVANDSIGWPAWIQQPTWVTGFTVLRWVNDVYAGFQNVTAATMFGGWSDNGSGWSSPAVLPFDFNNPPNVAKVLWNRVDDSSLPTVMATVPWAGGTAFDSTASSQLVRGICDDLRRSLDATFAFWVCPSDEGHVGVVRGSSNAMFRLHCASSGTGFEFGDAGELFIDGHQAGDWYLVVMRNDVGANTLTMDALRQRDSVQGSVTIPFPANASALGAGDNYQAEGLSSALSVGGPWFSDPAMAAYVDRIGVWNRRLTNEEVLALFNGGVAWAP